MRPLIKLRGSIWPGFSAALAERSAAVPAAPDEVSEAIAETVLSAGLHFEREASAWISAPVLQVPF